MLSTFPTTIKYSTVPVSYLFLYFKDGSKAKIIEILEKDQQMIGQIIQFLITHQNNEVKTYY